MASFRSAFPSKYLKADDLNGPVDWTVVGVALEAVGQGDAQEKKLVMHFREQPKGLVLNLINSETTAEVAGTEDTDQWPGLRICLYPTKTEFNGRRVPCIRVRPCASGPRKAPPPARDIDTVMGDGAEGTY